MNTYNKPSKGFWVIAIIAILWNIMGTFQFLSATVLKEMLYETLTNNQIALFENLPIWYTIIFWNCSNHRIAWKYFVTLAQKNFDINVYYIIISSYNTNGILDTCNRCY